MSMIWGGKLDSKLSDATSAVTKINFANAYGRLQYSTKAYPSPALTKTEWEIVFKIIGQKLGKDSVPAGYDGTSWILDNNYYSNLSDEVKEAFRKRYAMRPYMFHGTAGPDSSTYAYDTGTFGTKFEETYLQISNMQIEGYEGLSDHYNSDGTLKEGHEKWYSSKAMPEYIIYRIRQELSELEHIGNIQTNIEQLEVVDRMERCLVDKKGGLSINGQEQLDNLFRYYADDRSSSYTIYYDVKTMLPLMHIKDDVFVKDGGVKLNYRTGTQIDIRENTQNGKQAITNFFHDLPIGTIVKRSEILALDPEVQPTKFNNQLDYSIREDIARWIRHYDLNVTNPDNIADYEFKFLGWSDDSGGAISPENEVAVMHAIYTYVTDGKVTGDFKIKYGTPYYKWTRTVKYKEYEDDGILGTSFIIDADTFPADYRIVGETYIRNQKTGKDQRYQITIFRANVSSDTSITLQADGDPTTFTMDIDVLTPENDIMMEMRQIDVEEDRFEGGTRIVPQHGKYTYTPAMTDAGEVLTPIDNNEIY